MASVSRITFINALDEEIVKIKFFQAFPDPQLVYTQVVNNLLWSTKTSLTSRYIKSQ